MDAFSAGDDEEEECDDGDAGRADEICRIRTRRYRSGEEPTSVGGLRYQESSNARMHNDSEDLESYLSIDW